MSGTSADASIAAIVKLLERDASTFLARHAMQIVSINIQE